MQSLVRISDTLSRLCGVISMTLIAAAVVVVSQMVFVRYILNQSTVWQTEFVIYAILASTFIGAPYVLMQKGHVNVDLLPGALPRNGRLTLKYVAAIFSFAFCALIAWSSWHFFIEAFTKGWRTETVWAIPLWIPVLPLPLGMSMVCIQLLAELLKREDDRLAGGHGA